MQKRNHKTAVEARRALITNGFVTEHSMPGEPMIWRKPKTKQPRYCVAQDGKVYHIVDVQQAYTSDEFDWME